jgi:outer membrane protein assembly factor BamB
MRWVLTPIPDVALADTLERRIPGSTRAVLYALDAQTGKTLWSSKNQITSWNH